MDQDRPQLMCAVCGEEPAVGVAAIPGVPASDAYGARCLEANAHPMWALVANTALIGGLHEAADWWVDMVQDTLTHLGVSVETFEREVAEATKSLEQGGMAP